MERTYQAYGLTNYRNIRQITRLNKEELQAIEVVGRVLPFKTNNYVVEELIDWERIDTDPIFTLNFPRREMLSKKHFSVVSKLLAQEVGKEEFIAAVNAVRLELNPNPSGQDHNVPMLGDIRLKGIQHKYRETVLFFPAQGQTCHAYCSFCFRWPQFSGMNELKFAMKETDLLLKYLRLHPQVTDVLFTGGDPMTMSASLLSAYIEPLLQPGLEHIRTIRIGSKALAYWPYRFISDVDAAEVLRLFEKVTATGKNLSFQAHFNHPVELSTAAVCEAIRRIRNTGAQIRTQSPLLRHINDSPEIWREMWRKQVDLSCIPYYMFVARDTGAKHYFEIPLEKCWDIFRARQEPSLRHHLVAWQRSGKRPELLRHLQYAESIGQPSRAIRTRPAGMEHGHLLPHVPQSRPYREIRTEPRNDPPAYPLRICPCHGQQPRQFPGLLEHHREIPHPARRLYLGLGRPGTCRQDR